MRLKNWIFVPLTLTGISTICTTSCSKKVKGISAPNVTLDSGQSLSAELTWSDKVRFNFTLSKDIPENMILDSVSFKRSETEAGKDKWLFVDTAHPTIKDKKLTVGFTALKTYAEVNPETTTGTLNFIFKNSSGKQTRSISGFIFNFKK